MRMYKFGSLSKGDWDKMANITNNKDKNSGSIIYSVDGNKKSVNTER